MKSVLAKIKGALSSVFPLHSNRAVQALRVELNNARTQAWLSGLYVDSLKAVNEDLKETNRAFLSANQRLQEDVASRTRLALSHESAHALTTRRLRAFEDAHAGEVFSHRLPVVDAHISRELPWSIVSLRLTLPAFTGGINISASADPRSFDVLACAHARALARQVEQAFYAKAMESFEELRNRVLKYKE